MGVLKVAYHAVSLAALKMLFGKEGVICGCNIVALALGGMLA